MSLESLRAKLPASRSHRYLNYAATAPMLAPAAEAMAEVARQGCEPMAAHFEAWLSRVEGTRRAVADAIVAPPDSITFTANTSSALALLASAFRWKPGDRVLFPADEFPSNRYVWQNLADLGVEACPVEPLPGVGFAEQLAGLDLARVRLVSLSAVSYRDGRRQDVAAVSRLCGAQGIQVMVDGIQAVGAIPVDVQAWGCDYLACGGQKWLLGPVGSGFLYVAPRHLEALRVPTTGWASSRSAGDFEVRELVFCDGARRFEGGLPDVAAIAGLGASLECLSQAGWPAVFARIAQHNLRLRAALAALGHAPLHDGPPETQAGIVTFDQPGDAEAQALAEACARRSILLTRRGRQFRVSAHATTSEDEIEAFLALLGATAPIRTAVVRPLVSPPAAPPKWRRALVTGASRGLGQAIAAALAQRGCDLLLLGRDLAALEATAAHLSAQHRVQVAVASVDLADPRGLEAWITAHARELSDLDVLVNNAAAAEAERFLEEDPARQRAAFEVNTLAPLALARAVLPGMVARGRGAMLNLVTSGARCALPLFATYSASKGALWAWSESLTRELDGSGVTVTTFLPPHMDTSTQHRLGRKALAHYKLTGKGPGAVPPLSVGETAVAALERGEPIVVPWASRLRHAANALFPNRIARGIRRAWRRPATSGR